MKGNAWESSEMHESWLISYEDFNRLLLLQRSFISLSMGKKLFLMCDGKQSSE